MPFLARGVPIYQLQLGGSRNVLGYDPIGQSFTAEDPQVSIGVHLRAASHMVPTGNEFRFDLLAGEDINGPLLGSCSLTLSEEFDSWADADFSFLTLSAGSKYTLRVTTADPDWVIFDNQWAATQGGILIPGKVDYPGGVELFSGEPFPYSDLQFRVKPVPEPACATLLLCGAVGLWATKRRQSRDR